MKIVAIIQARMSSTRLPGKVMLQLKDMSVLGHVLTRLQQVNSIDQIIVATTEAKIDDIINEECMKFGIACYRGSEDDVLSRYYEAALKTHADIIVRITSDCPLLDPALVEQVIQYYLSQNTHYARLDLTTYPRGLDVEVVSMKALEEAFNNTTSLEYREHVTLYIYDHPEKFGNVSFKYDQNLSQYRFTLDTKEDWKLIHKISEELYRPGMVFGFKEIVSWLEKNPTVAQINTGIEQKHSTK